MICVYKYFSTKKKEMCKPQNDFEKFNKISSILLPLFSYEISIEKVSQTQQSVCPFMSFFTQIKCKNPVVLRSCHWSENSTKFIGPKDYYDNLIYYFRCHQMSSSVRFKNSSSQIQHGQTASTAVVIAQHHLCFLTQHGKKPQYKYFCSDLCLFTESKYQSSQE